MYNKIKNIHMIGVGGIGMSGIAELLIRNGYTVTGSDKRKSEVTERLEQLGIHVLQGHDAAHIRGAELVVYSSAISTQNPEMAAAQKTGIPTIPRAEILAELMRLKYGIAVAGAHGKTTTTSMLAIILTEAGLDPTIVVGGRMDNFGGTNARLGGGEFMVVEADESDGSFNKLSPSIAIVTNIDREHMEYYKTMRKLQNAFLSFMNKVPFYGLCIFCGDDPYLRLLEPKVSRRKKTYGFSEQNAYQICQYEASEQGSKFQVKIGKDKETIRLSTPGRHNALNAVAAFALADELSVPRKQCLEGLLAYQGVRRRFQKWGNINGVLFVDDYAHHPTEIRATLAAAKEHYPQAKIRVVFQPHRYSRVEDLLDQFSTSFHQCDDLAITDIYAASEKKIPGIESNTLAEVINRQGLNRAIHISDPMVAIQHCLEQSKSGDIILTLGAGDLPNVYQQLF